MAHVLELIPPVMQQELEYSFDAPRLIYLDSDVITLGRGSKDIKVSHYLSLIKEERQYISRIHAEIRRNIDMATGGDGEIGEVFEIRDTKALNGLFVNDVRITAHTLNDGDIVQFGGISKQPAGTVLVDTDVCIRYRYRKEQRKRKITLSDSEKQSISSNESMTRIASESVLTAPNSPQQPISSHCSPASPSPSKRLIPKSNLDDSSNVAYGQIQSESHNICKLIPTMLASESDQLVDMKLSGMSNLSSDSDSMVNELKKQLEDVRNSEASLQERVNELSKMLNDERNAKKASIPFESIGDMFVQSGIDIQQVEQSNAATIWTVCGKSMESCLSCILCHRLLAQPVVLQCSHGYCRACIESLWKAGNESMQQSNGYHNTNNKSNKAKRDGFCPVCNCICSSYSSSSSGYSYCRSDHLDNIIWLILESGTEQQRQEYAQREQRDRVRLESLNIDPNAPLHLMEDADDDDSSAGSNGNHKEHRRAADRGDSDRDLCYDSHDDDSD